MKILLLTALLVAGDYVQTANDLSYYEIDDDYQGTDFMLNPKLICSKVCSCQTGCLMDLLMFTKSNSF